MNILIVTDSLVTGGAETFVLRLARALIARGHGCDVLNLNPDFEDARLTTQFPDVPIIRVPLRGLRTRKRLDRLARMLGQEGGFQRRSDRRWVRRHLSRSYDVYHTHLWGPDRLFAGIASEDPSVRVVSTQHGDYGKLLDGMGGSETMQVPQFAKRFTAVEPFIARFVTISDPQTRLLETELGVAPSKVVKILNGYAPPTKGIAAPRTDHRLCFAMAARGIPEKGWRPLVEAFRQTEIDGRLLLIGEGRLLDELQAECSSDPRIEFVGHQANPVEWIRNADLFIHPSLHPSESLPTVIVEALSCGVPVLATDVGEVANMISTPNGEMAGTTIPQEPGTLVADLRRAMINYAVDRELLHLHASRATVAFEKFSMDRCADAYLALFADVANAATV